MLKYLPCFLVLASSATFASAGIRQDSAIKFGVIAKYKIGGDGGWDYLTVDPDAHRLYVSRGTHVMVVDENQGNVIGDIPNTPGVHGIALVPRLGKGYVSAGRDNSVVVFDPKTLKTLGKIPAGENPDAIFYDAASSRVITCNGRSGDMTVIDPASDKVLGTIKLAGKPETPVSDGRFIYVNIEDKGEIEKVDLKSMKSLGTWPLAPGESPSGLAIDRRRHTLFATCDNNILAVVDTNTGKVIATPKIGNGPDAAGFDPRLGLAISSNGEGTLTLVKRKADGQYVTATVATQPSARTMALNEKTHRIYLSAAEMQPGEGRRRPMVPGSFTIVVVGPIK